MWVNTSSRSRFEQRCETFYRLGQTQTRLHKEDGQGLKITDLGTGNIILSCVPVSRVLLQMRKRQISPGETHFPALFCFRYSHVTRVSKEVKLKVNESFGSLRAYFLKYSDNWHFSVE